MFPLNKILTVNVVDYCNSVGKTIFEYNLVGVHLDDAKTTDQLISEFAKQVPPNTEVVVNFIYNVAVAYSKGILSDHKSSFQYASGVALIPKNIEG